MTIRAIAVAGLAFLAACETAPDYGPASREGAKGYSEQRIETGRYRIRYQERSGARLSEAMDKALLRAAELTRKNGASWFQVVSRDSEKEETGGRSGVGFGVGTGGRIGGSGFGALSLSTGTGSRSGAPVAILEIVIGTGEKPEGPDVYDADEVYASLSSAK
ncbi:MAG: hypothetical protein AAFR11_06475 [Pseudomonadota bacterium]